MSRKLFLLFLIMAFSGFVIYKMVFSPVSLTFESRPIKILTNSPVPVIVDVFSINRLGFRIPFRSLDGKFVVNEGAEKIDIVQEKGDELVFKTRNSAGTLVIFYYVLGVPFPMQIVLNIEGASLAATTHFPFSFG